MYSCHSFVIFIVPKFVFIFGFFLSGDVLLPVRRFSRVSVDEIWQWVKLVERSLVLADFLRINLGCYEIC